jgi:hypothetical protein
LTRCTVVAELNFGEIQVADPPWAFRASPYSSGELSGVRFGQAASQPAMTATSTKLGDIQIAVMIDAISAVMSGMVLPTHFPRFGRRSILSLLFSFSVLAEEA